MPQSPLEKYQARQAERARQEKERAPKPWYWLGQRDAVARFTLYLGVFTLGLIFVGLLQWLSIRGQLAEMKAGGKDTHDLALAAKLDQRAWVGFALLTMETPKIGDVPHASVTYVNTGRTPAKNVAPITRLRFVPAMVSSEKELSELSKEGGSPATILGVMYPGMPYPAPIDGIKPFNSADLTAIKSWYTYIWGEVGYMDVFDNCHMMEFCAYRQGTTGGFLQCPFHNQPDYQKRPEGKFQKCRSN